MKPKQNKRQQQAYNTKWNIYNCAHRLFQEKGFESVSVEEIAEAAGVSVGLFYYYFKSKQEIIAIYHEKMDAFYSRYYDESRASGIWSDKTVLQILEDFTLYICETCVGQGVAYIRILYPYMLTDRVFGSAMTDSGRAYFSIMNELFSLGIERGEIAGKFGSTQLVNDLTKLIRGCIVDWCINDGREDIRERSHNLISIFLKGIASS